jgi:hypothetical protein
VSHDVRLYGGRDHCDRCRQRYERAKAEYPVRQLGKILRFGHPQFDCGPFGEPEPEDTTDYSEQLQMSIDAIKRERGIE